jgi:hypothetical protein
MKRYLIFAICLSVLSCKSSTETVTSASVIMPLAVGNEWDYAGFFLIASQQHVIFDTTKIVSSKVTAFATQYGTYYENRSDGLWIVSDSATPTYTGLIAKYPANSGDFVRRDTTVGIDTIISDVIVDSVNSVVTVPSGTYSCFKYTTNYYDLKHILQRQDNDYYAVNVGEIKDELFEVDSVSHQLTLFLSRQLAKVILH